MDTGPSRASARSSAARASASSWRAILLSARSTCAWRELRVGLEHAVVMDDRLVVATGEMQHATDARLDDEREGIQLERAAHLGEGGIEARAGRQVHRVPLARRRVTGVERRAQRANSASAPAQSQSKRNLMNASDACASARPRPASAPSWRLARACSIRPPLDAAAEADGDQRAAVREAGVGQRVPRDPPPPRARTACGRSLERVAGPLVQEIPAAQ